MDIIKVLIRTLFFYLFIHASYRIMGKREIGKLSITDLSISMLIAELVAMSIENYESNIFLTVLPIVLLVILEISLSLLLLKINRAHQITDGKPSIIIDRGVLNTKEMLRQRYSIDDLLLEIRGKDIKSIADIDYAVLETNGKLSIFKKDNRDNEPPLPLIIDGKVDNDILKNIGKSKTWLTNLLLDSNVPLENILYAFYRNSKIYIVRK